MKTLFILNDSPYGSEKSYNALRLATRMASHTEAKLRVFLMGDAAASGKAGQRVPKGYYNLERMLRAIARRDGEIRACGSCMDARGMEDVELAEAVRRGTLEDLADWTRWADQVLVF
jgi:uncharacterized protein involved in oxidation of intracellular sulfur